MGKQWHYKDGDRIVGPLTDEQLKGLASVGRVTPTTLVTSPGASEWVPASRIVNLFDGQSSNVIVAPATPQLPPLPPANGATPPLAAGTGGRLNTKTVVAAVIATTAACVLISLCMFLFAVDRSKNPAAGMSAHATMMGVEKSTTGTHGTFPKPNESEVERDRLLREKNALRSEVEELKREREKLTKEIRELSARAESLHKWNSAQFVMVNPTHFAVGIDVLPDDSFVVVNRSMDGDAEAAIRIASRAGIPRIANNRALTRKIFYESKQGESLSGPLTSEVKRYWKTHRYCPFRPDEVPVFLVFTDLSRSRQRVGFYAGETAEAIQIQGLSPHVETIPRHLVQAGSARKIPGDEVLELLGDLDLLDFGAFKIAQMVGSNEGTQSHVDIAVKVKLEILDEMIAFSKTPDHSGLDQFFEFFNRFLGTPIKRDSRKSAITVLREAEKSLENEAYAKLIKMGLPVVEREHLNLVQQERALARSEGLTDRYGKLVCASHLVVLEVSRSDFNNSYGLSIRLIDVDTSRVVWAMVGDRSKRVSKLGSAQAPFLLQSGRLAIVHPKSNAVPSPFSAVEQPPILLPSRPTSLNSSVSHVVQIERDDLEEIAYRSLFGNQILAVPKSTIEKVDYLSDVRDVPRVHPEHFRAIAWRIAKGLLPPAGKLSRTSTGLLTVPLGRSMGLTPETRFRLIRNDSTGSLAGHRVLPIDLAVTHIRDGDCDVVSVREAALISDSADNEAQPTDGDIAVVSNVDVTSVALFAPRYANSAAAPQQDLLRNRRQQTQTHKHQTQSTYRAERAAKQLQDRLATCFRRLGLTVHLLSDNPTATAASPPLATPVRTGTTVVNPYAHSTHRIRGTIRILSDSLYHVTLDTTVNGTNTVVDHVAFDVAESELR